MGLLCVSKGLDEELGLAENVEGSSEAMFALYPHIPHRQVLDLGRLNPGPGPSPVPRSLSSLAYLPGSPRRRASAFLMGWGAILWPYLKATIRESSAELDTRLGGAA